MKWPLDSRIILLALLILGFALRLDPALSYWINGDEGIYYRAVHLDWAGFWQQVIGNAHPPLFYLILRPLGLLGSDPLWLRLPALLASCLGIYGMFLLGRALSNERCGLFAAAMWALLPAPLEMGVLARPYALQWTCLIFALLGLTRFLKQGERSGLRLYAICMTLALLLHYSSFIAAAGIGLGLILLWLRKRIPRTETWPLLWSQLPVLLAVAALYFWHVQASLQGGLMQSIAVDGYLAPFMIDGPASAWRNLIGVFEFLAGRGYGGASFLLWLASLFLLARRGLENFGLFTFLSLLIALSLSFLQLYPFGATRHSGYLDVLILPCLAMAATRISSQGPIRGFTILIISLVILLSGAQIDHALGLDPDRSPRFLELRMPREAAEEMAAILEELQQEKGLIITDPRTAMTLDPFLHRARETQVGGSIPWGEQVILLAQDWELELRAQGADRPQHLSQILRRAEEDPELAAHMSHGLRILSASGARLLNRARALGKSGSKSRELVNGSVERDKLVLFRLDARGYQIEIEERR